MIYEWKCKSCGTVVEVQRKLADYDKPPTKDEVPECTEWVKVYSSSSDFETMRNKGILERLPTF